MTRTKTKYNNTSIASILKSINSREIFLPALQRKYVWKTEQIESFFDSIMQGYPIGTFLFWNLHADKAKEYVFYEFIKNYNPRKSRNEKATLASKLNNVIGVLDGQQRLTSLYIAFYGSYKEKIAGKWSSKANSWETKQLYLNMITNNNEYDDFKYEFKFLTEKESKHTNENQIWYRVKDVIAWGKNIGKNPTRDYNRLKANNSNAKLKRIEILSILKLLHKRVYEDGYLTYFDLKNMDIDDVLDIFIRVNSGGTTLSKSDLLMSTITVNWDEARDKVDELLEKINGDQFSFDTDFIMRTSLVLLDHAVLFKVKSFNLDTVKNIKKEWSNISEAIRKTIHMLVELGFGEKTLTSKNAIIPIMYYIYKGGDTKDKSREEIKLYLQTALIAKFFGSHGDHILAKMREMLREEDEEGSYKLKNRKFDFKNLKYINIIGKTLDIGQKEIDIFLEEKKGRNALVVLTLLYPSWNFNETPFDQDHIYPADDFKDKNLFALGLDTQDVEEWQEMKDQIPNLQILATRKNRVKNDKDFKTWMSKQDDKYIQNNYIPKDISYELKDFKEFFEKRKMMLKEKLAVVLKINLTESLS